MRNPTLVAVPESNAVRELFARLGIVATERELVAVTKALARLAPPHSGNDAT